MLYVSARSGLRDKKGKEQKNSVGIVGLGNRLIECHEIARKDNTSAYFCSNLYMLIGK